MNKSTRKVISIQPLNITTKVDLALNWICSIFDKEKILYQISGGVAASFYGSYRSINDIDIDIQQKDFPRLFNRVKKFVRFGPELYIDSEWMAIIMELNYDNQVIEITDCTNQKIFDEDASSWRLFKYDLDDVLYVKWNNKIIRLMKPERMIIYKKLLHGDKQRKDIKKIKKFINKNK